MLNAAPPRPDGKFVLYWMTAYRRTHWNFALQQAVNHALVFRRPLVILEAVRAGYEWASDRMHRFVIDGMRDNAARVSQLPFVTYHPYVEPRDGDGKGLVEALAADACVVVSDDWPAFFLPRMLAATAARLPVRFEVVDSNGLLPMRAADHAFPTAFSFRAFLHRELEPHLGAFPIPDPLTGAKLPKAKPLAKEILVRWPAAALSDPAALVKSLPIDHGVGVGAQEGGETAAKKLLETFIADRLPRYLERSEPDSDAASGLSPHLHFGHVSAHEIFAAVARKEEWDESRLAPKGGGKKEGWWNMSAPAEAFLDQVVTWRELGFNMSSKRADFEAWESLPGWAIATLEKHAKDPRPHLYTADELERAVTHDPLWNAAQRQLVTEGRLHNYLRMLWGKKVLEWSRTPQEALGTLIHLNNKYALDGRDPNSYSGIFWTFGRYDRPWGPERPIFGLIRYMTSDSTARKFNVKQYVARHTPRIDLFSR